MNPFLTHTEIADATMLANKNNLTDWEKCQLMFYFVRLHGTAKKGEIRQRIKNLFYTDQQKFDRALQPALEHFKNKKELE